MLNLVSLLTLLVFCLGMTGNVLAQREVKPPANTPMDAKPALAPPVQASTVPTITPKPEPTAKTQPEKPNKKTKSAPVQAATVPTATETKTAPKPVQSAKTQPEKAKKAAKQAATNEETAKPKAKKNPRICKTNAKQESHKVAQAKKETTKVAKKTGTKQVIRATTCPIP
jgi:cytoskeletal protein RodZ